MHALLIEDSERLCRSLTAGLRRAGWAVDVHGDGKRGLSHALHNPYDVVILDLGLPALDGLELLRGLRKAGRDVAVLVLTARDAIEDRVAGLSAGADDYLIKPFAFEELMARLQALVRRTYGRSSGVVTVRDLSVHLAERRVERAGRELTLTRRDYALLELLALRRGAVVSRIDIEDHLYDEHTLPASNAVDSAICALRAKLELQGQPRLIHTVRGLGYSLAERSD